MCSRCMNAVSVKANFSRKNLSCGMAEGRESCVEMRQEALWKKELDFTLYKKWFSPYLYLFFFFQNINFAKLHVWCRLPWSRVLWSSKTPTTIKFPLQQSAYIQETRIGRSGNLLQYVARCQPSQPWHSCFAPQEEIQTSKAATDISLINTFRSACHAGEHGDKGPCRFIHAHAHVCLLAK